MADSPQISSRVSGDLAARLAAAKRAMPQARVVDYGLTAADAAQLQALDEQGQTEWWTAAEAIGERHLEKARRHDAASERAQGMLARERAAAAFNIAQLAMHRDDEEKRCLYGRASACLEANAGDSRCDYRRLIVPAGGGRSLYGWDFPVPGAIGHVVMFGGLSGWGASFMRLARALNRQGVRAILAEAPGQGETRLRSGLYLSRDGLSQALRFIDMAAADGNPVALVGFSFGGLIAAHLAAAVPDVAALCTNGSPVAIGALNHPAEREQFAGAFGAEGDDLLRQVKDFAFDADRQALACPLLSLEGGADPLVPVGTWQGFAGKAHPSATTAFWEDGLHTLYNHAEERDALIAAWISDCFGQGMDS